MQYQKQSPDTIRTMFDSIATRYDRANSVMSMMTHKIWNRKLLRAVYEKNGSSRCLDLCCGTGEIGLEYLAKAAKPTEMTFLDFSPKMLECAKEKAVALAHSQHKLSFVEADAQKIPLSDNTFDAATMAYGIRNIKDPALCAKEVFRLLQEGGTFGILELTRPKNPLVRMGHKLYLRTVLPLIGKMVSANKEAYQYLSGSIDQFLSPEQLVRILEEAGFRRVEARPLFGGIATLFLAKK